MRNKTLKDDRVETYILTCRVKIAHVTQEPMHMSASPWIVVRKHWSGAPNENIVQNHLNIALLNLF